MENKILILASTSFIGINIKKYLEKKYNVFCLHRQLVDFKDQTLLQDKIKNINPNIVINCCGIVGSSIKNDKLNDFDLLNENIILNINILNACKKLNITKIIMFSSYRLFGDDIHENYNENDIQLSSIKYNKGYLTAKKILDTQIELFMKEYKINIVCLIMTNIFGCYDDFSINSRIVPSMIANIKKHNDENADMTISSNKNILVNLVFVEDISRIIELCILSENVQGNILIFNKQGTITLENLTIQISKILNYQKKITFINDVASHNNNNIMKPNLSKFYTLFEDFKFTDLKTSLEKTIDFINLTKSE